MNEKKKEKLLGVEDSGEKDSGGGEKNGDREEKSGYGAALGICFGCAFGLLVQVLTGNIIWLPIGAAIGCGLGIAAGGSGKKGE